MRFKISKLRRGKKIFQKRFSVEKKQPLTNRKPSELSFLFPPIPSSQQKGGEIRESKKETMKNVINPIGNVAETRSGNDGVSSNAITTNGQGGYEREVEGADQGGVALQLNQLSRAYQNGSEFQYGKTLTSSCGDGGFHIEKCNFRALFACH